MNPAALDLVKTSYVFKKSLNILSSANSVALPLDTILDDAVAQEVYVSSQEFVNRTKTAGQVMASIRRAALIAKSKK